MAFLYSVLPQYTKSTDILTDYNTYGEVKVLKTFLDTIDSEMFDIVANSIRELSTFVNVYTIRDEYLPYFAYLLGYKWNSFLSNENQKYIVANIIELYRRKGTKFSFYFNLRFYDPLITVEEPYKKIFMLNRPGLNTKHFSSRNYYSPGVLVFKVRNAGNWLEELYELIEQSRPAGWNVIIESIYELFYNLYIKPNEIRRKEYSLRRYTIRDNKNEDQVQFYHSIQYAGEPFNLITMVGETLLSVSDWTLNDLGHMSILHTNKDVERCTFRLPLQRSDYANGNINLPIVLGHTTLMLSRWTINDLADLNILFPLYGNDEGTLRVLGKQYTSYNTSI